MYAKPAFCQWSSISSACERRTSHVLQQLVVSRPQLRHLALQPGPGLLELDLAGEPVFLQVSK